MFGPLQGNGTFTIESTLFRVKRPPSPAMFASIDDARLWHWREHSLPSTHGTDREDQCAGASAAPDDCSGAVLHRGDPRRRDQPAAGGGAGPDHEPVPHLRVQG